MLIRSLLLTLIIALISLNSVLAVFVVTDDEEVRASTFSQKGYEDICSIQVRTKYGLFTGSGCLISLDPMTTESRFILTAQHVTKDADETTVRFGFLSYRVHTQHNLDMVFQQKSYSGSSQDICLLELTEPVTHIKPRLLEVYKGTDCATTEPLTKCGSDEWIVTGFGMGGVVSHKCTNTPVNSGIFRKGSTTVNPLRVAFKETGSALLMYTPTNVAVDHGDSGSAIINTRGSCIGILVTVTGSPSREFESLEIAYEEAYGHKPSGLFRKILWDSVTDYLVRPQTRFAPEDSCNFAAAITSQVYQRIRVIMNKAPTDEKPSETSLYSLALRRSFLSGLKNMYVNRTIRKG